VCAGRRDTAKVAPTQDHSFIGRLHAETSVWRWKSTPKSRRRVAKRGSHEPQGLGELIEDQMGPPGILELICLARR
jgi:hypothetical protein